MELSAPLCKCGTTTATGEVSLRQIADATLRSQKLTYTASGEWRSQKEGNGTHLLLTLRRQKQGMGNLRQGLCTSEANQAICNLQHCHFTEWSKSTGQTRKVAQWVKHSLHRPGSQEKWMKTRTQRCTSGIPALLWPKQYRQECVPGEQDRLPLRDRDRHSRRGSSLFCSETEVHCAMLTDLELNMKTR